MISGLCDAIFTTTAQGTGIDIAFDFKYPHCSPSTIDCIAINRTSTNGSGPLIVVGATTLDTPTLSDPMMKPQARSAMLPNMDGVVSVSIVITLCLTLLLRMFFSAHVEWARSFSPAALHDIGMHPNRTLKKSWHAWMRAHPPSKTKKATIIELMGLRHPGVDEEEVEQAEAMPEPQQNLGAMSRTSPACNSVVSDSHTNEDAVTQIKSELEDLVVARQRILELEDLLTAPDQISQFEAITILEKRNRNLQHELWASEQALADLETDFEQLEYRFYISIAKEKKLYDENKRLKQQLETTRKEMAQLQNHEEFVEPRGRNVSRS